MPSGFTRVYVGKLPRQATDSDVEKLASEYGRVRDCRVLVGFAFVEFEDDRDARDCVKDLDGQKFMGERLMVQAARSQTDGRHGDRRDDRYSDRRRDRSPPRPRSSRSEYRLTVDGLPTRTSWQDLKDLMRKAGEVVYSDIDKNGVGIVEFSSGADMAEALKMFDDFEYEGSRISVKEVVGVRVERNDRSPRRRSRSPAPRRYSRSPPRRRSRSPPRRRSVSPRREKSPRRDRSP
ncbi:hypothetical protein BDK51DRAFT_15479 [Blyttiomyces helicus]|uniref:RRM domain-containing protein n=1 Tax=Blyttiomyces helicus TaxID=388810 RepID=A0A4P9W3G8_9FUNG|nr:hypothetical protein BDK51DRAFT_15479 [Blyttiomyces helicus]|eukprot:RKO85835.1 hypothetical protein BDK51DRAFT_15479 [Blyttiomyces helicus]